LRLRGGRAWPWKSRAVGKPAVWGPRKTRRFTTEGSFQPREKSACIGVIRQGKKKIFDRAPSTARGMRRRVRQRRGDAKISPEEDVGLGQDTPLGEPILTDALTVWRKFRAKKRTPRGGGAEKMSRKEKKLPIAPEEKTKNYPFIEILRERILRVTLGTEVAIERPSGARRKEKKGPADDDVVKGRRKGPKNFEERQSPMRGRKKGSIQKGSPRKKRSWGRKKISQPNHKIEAPPPRSLATGIEGTAGKKRYQEKTMVPHAYGARGN